MGLAALWVALLLGMATGAGAGTPGEYEVKGAFLYNFAKFVQWPEAALEGRSAFDICLLGDVEIQQALAGVVKQRQIDGRPVKVRQIEAPRGLDGCQVLFVTEASGSSAEEIARGTAGSSILTVGETRRFTAQGGMINFVQVGKKVRFEINKRSAEAAGLAVSSRLLKLAHEVHE